MDAAFTNRLFGTKPHISLKERSILGFCFVGGRCPKVRSYKTKILCFKERLQLITSLKVHLHLTFVGTCDFYSTQDLNEFTLS